MKKLKTFIIMCFLTIFLTSCIKRYYYYSYEEMKEKTLSVEILNILVGRYSWDIDVKIAESIKILNEEEKDKFLYKLSTIEFRYPWGDPPREIQGYIFKINYDNEYEKLSKNITRFYNYQNRHIGGYFRYCSDKDFKEILSMFIEVDDYLFEGWYEA